MSSWRRRNSLTRKLLVVVAVAAAACAGVVIVINGPAPLHKAMNTMIGLVGAANRRLTASVGGQQLAN